MGENLCGLDPGIAHIVDALRAHGVETFESCEGGAGHSYAEPTVAFHGVYAAGFHALSIALGLGLPVRDLRRVWEVVRGEPSGPVWQMTFMNQTSPVVASPDRAAGTTDTDGDRPCPYSY
ncbi:MAG: hypothetical protein ACR2MC_02000 [Actinomycetota bacterium]